MRMAPLLTAFAPFLLLPALLAGLGHPAALPFAGFSGGLALLAVAALVGIGIGRLPLVCLGGFAALGASLMPLLTIDLGWPAAAALTAIPLAGLILGGAVWLSVRGLARVVATALLLALLLGLASLPALTTDLALAPAGLDELGGLALEALTLEVGAFDALALLPVLVLSLLLLAAARFRSSTVARLHEAAVQARLPADGLGLELAAFHAWTIMLAAGIATLAGGILALGATPIIGIAPSDWVALSLSLFAIGRLGGVRLGGTLLAALPLALLPKLTVVLAPQVIDLTLAAALAALVLQLIIRPDGSPAWQPTQAPFAGSARLTER